VTKVAKVKLVLPELLASPVLAVHRDLLEAREPLVLKVIPVRAVLPVSRVKQV